MIEVRRLTKRYGPVAAVTDLSFTVQPGMVTGFLGPNGAGKTTTMRLILGLGSPTEGTATINGRRFAELPSPMREVGALLDARAVHASRHLVVIGRGRLIADTGIEEFVRSRSPEAVMVRTAAASFAHTLTEHGATVTGGAEDALIVTGMTGLEIGKLAAARGVVLHELSPQRPTLEEAFMELTRDSVQYGVAEGSPR